MSPFEFFRVIVTLNGSGKNRRDFQQSSTRLYSTGQSRTWFLRWIDLCLLYNGDFYDAVTIALGFICDVFCYGSVTKTLTKATITLIRCLWRMTLERCHMASFVRAWDRINSQRMKGATTTLKASEKNNSGDYKPNNDTNQYTLKSRNSQEWYYWPFWLHLCWGVGVFSIL